MSRTDPKHGRWILPLVIAGLVGFTYLFVNALPPSETASDTSTGDTTATDTTTGDTDDGTDDDGNGSAITGDGTVTTLPPETLAFLTNVDDYAARTASLAEEAQTINDEWDARTTRLTPTRDALTDLATRTVALATEISEADVPTEATEAWNLVITSAQTLSTAAEDMLDGLVNSSTADKRLGALETYTTTAGDLAAGFGLARSAVGG